MLDFLMGTCHLKLAKCIVSAIIELFIVNHISAGVDLGPSQKTKGGGRSKQNKTYIVTTKKSTK